MMVFTDDSHRDLKVKEVAASMARPRPAGPGKKKVEAGAPASMGRPAGAGKKEAAGASEPRVPLACLFPIESAAEARPVGAGKRRKASASEPCPAGTGKKTEDATATAEKKESLWKEGEMLRLREDLREAERLWAEMREKAVLGAITQKPAVAEKRNKKKLVRVIWPDASIKYIKENPYMMPELSDKEMDECRNRNSRYHQSYVMFKIINAKKRSYHQALIEQHDAFGYAYDEVEVTDDDENDKQEVAAVKN